MGTYPTTNGYYNYRKPVSVVNLNGSELGITVTTICLQSPGIYSAESAVSEFAWMLRR